MFFLYLYTELFLFRRFIQSNNHNDRTSLIEYIPVASPFVFQALLLQSRFSEETSCLESNEILKLYRKVISVNPDWEDGHFYIGKYYDKIITTLLEDKHDKERINPAKQWSEFFCSVPYPLPPPPHHHYWQWSVFKGHPYSQSICQNSSFLLQPNITV